MFDLYGDEPSIIAAVEAALAGEEIDLVLDYEGRRTQAAYRPLRLSNGTVAGGTVSAVDITELMLTTEALTRTEARSRALLEHVSEIIVITDADGFITDAEVGSPGAFGYTPEDVLNRLGWDFLHPDDISRIRAVWDELLDQPGAQREVHLRLRHADGTWGWAEETITNALDDPVISGIVINCRDVTQTRRAQEALVESERRNRRVVEASSDAIAVLDDRRRILLANPRLAELIGCRRDELIGAEFSDLGLPEPAPFGDPAPVEVSSQGRTLWLRVSATALATTDGASERTLGRHHRRHRTHRYAAADGRHRTAPGGRPVRGRGRARLQQRPDRDSRACRAADGGAAADALRTSRTRWPSCAGPSGLRRSYSSCSPSRAASGWSPPSSTSTTSSMACWRCVRIFSATGSLSPSTLTRSAVAYVDAVQLERVIGNLVLNARDAITGAGTIDISVTAAEGQVVIAVADDGRGMTEEEASRCFEPFFTTKNSGNGTGLGLASVYGVVTQSGGSIDVETALGQGRAS